MTLGRTNLPTELPRSSCTAALSCRPIAGCQGIRSDAIYILMKLLGVSDYTLFDRFFLPVYNVIDITLTDTLTAILYHPTKPLSVYCFDGMFSHPKVRSALTCYYPENFALLTPLPPTTRLVLSTPPGIPHPHAFLLLPLP